MLCNPSDDDGVIEADDGMGLGVGAREVENDGGRQRFVMFRDTL